MVKEIFKKITGYDPYPHQIEIFEALSKGESVILRAPTGSGKSEAVFIPFLELRGKILPKRMTYSLPMRALVNSLHERFQQYGLYLILSRTLRLADRWATESVTKVMNNLEKKSQCIGDLWRLN